MKNKGDIDDFLRALFTREAGGVDHTKVNSAGYIGKYQFGESALIDLGYYTGDGTKKNDWSGKWMGKNDVNSLGDFLNSDSVQDVAGKEWVALLCKRMRIYKLDSYIGKTIKGIEITDSGIIAGAHLKGFGSEKYPGLRQFLKSNGDIDPKDGYGTTVSHYVKLFANYDVGCCKQACIAFVEKQTGAPIAGMAVRIKKNGKILKTSRTSSSGLLTTPFAFQSGDAIEVLVEKVAGGYKSLKTAIVDDANLIFAFVSPKAKAVVTTEAHKGKPQPRAATTKSVTLPTPKLTTSVNAASTAAAPTVHAPRASTDKSTATGVAGKSTSNITTATTGAQVVADTTSSENATLDQLDAMEKIWRRMCSYQAKDVLTADNAAEGQPAGNEVTKIAEAGDGTSTESAVEQTTDNTQKTNVEASPVENARNTKGHPVAAVKKKERPPAPKVLAPMQKVVPGLLFPLEKKPEKSYKTDARQFGSNRSNGRRRHAGIDLYAPVGTPVRAMADGVVIQTYLFYGGTHVIEVDHATFIARYGEVAKESILVKEKEKITRGQTIGKVGQLKGFNISMLHLEMYGTTENPMISGKGLTQKGEAPFERRSDLIDPTDSIDQAALR
jgi:murein DD-endopeptidase MepM/ murein hydrolase activator NlpD